MSDISKIKIPSGTTYEIKDSVARNEIDMLNEFYRTLLNIVDVDNSKDTLILNIGENKVQLIFNDDNTVGWDYTKLENKSIISVTDIKLGKSIIITGEASGGKKPYSYKFEEKHESEQDYYVLSDFGKTTERPWQPQRTGTYDIRITVKDSTNATVEKNFELIVAAVSSDALIIEDFYEK